MSRLLATLLLSLFVLVGCATTPLPPAPTIDEIVQWSNEKMPPEQIIERMKAARAVYRLSGSQLADLKNRGVPDGVLDYMQETYIAAERWEQHLQTRDQYFFYGWPGYYHPFGPYWWRPYYRHR